MIRDFVRRFGYRDYLIATVILGVSISPEIPVDLFSAHLDFTIRFQDLFLASVLLGWILWRPATKRIFVPGFLKYYATFLVLVIGLTLANGIFRGLPLLRSSFYLLKQIEVMLLGILVMALIATDRNLKTVRDVILLGAILNGGWVGYQILMGDYGPLFFTADMDSGVYGASLIGQIAVLASGGYYIPAICLTASNALVHDRTSVKLLYSALCLAFFLAMAASVSRASILGAIVAVLVIVFVYREKTVKTYLRIGLVAVVGFLMAFLMETMYSLPIFHRFTGAIDGVIIRVQQWVPMVQEGIPYLLLGYGAASLDPFFGHAEAHNFFLRTLIVGGVVGLALFLIHLIKVCQWSYSAWNSSESHYVTTLSMMAFGTTVGFSIISMFQDAFLNVTLAEMFWISVGAMGGGLLVGSPELWDVRIEDV